MEIVLANLRFGLGGTETYVMTVAEQLQRFGHQVTIYAPERDAGTALARTRGLRLVEQEDALPAACDVVYAQDAIVGTQLAERYPETPQVYGFHSPLYDLAVPPQLPGLASAVVTLNERTARRARSLAVDTEVVRLRHPIDTKRFTPLTPLPKQARRVLLYGNYLNGDRRALVEGVCRDLGLECTQIGAQAGNMTERPELELCKADIVLGMARTVPEAMACGRAVYVYDMLGADGWVTPERYPDLEADNFVGATRAEPIDADQLRTDFRGYDPEMGTVNRQLVFTNHLASLHAEQLVQLFGRLAPRAEPGDTPLREVSRLVRLQWSAERRALDLAEELGAYRREQLRLAEEAERLRTALEQAQSRADDAEARERDFRATRRFRLAAALARPVDRIRSLRSSTRAS